MTAGPETVLILGGAEKSAGEELLRIRGQLEPQYHCVVATDPLDLVRRLAEEPIAGVVVLTPDNSPHTRSAAEFLAVEGLLDHLTEGLALLGPEREILWHNPQFVELAGQCHCDCCALDGDESTPSEGRVELDDGPRSVRGLPFDRVFANVEMLGPDFCPFTEALGSGEPGRSVMKCGDRHFLDVTVVAIDEEPDETDPASLLVLATVRDISEETLTQQKHEAIYQAGVDLRDLAPGEVLDMTVEERTELLKLKIQFYAKDVLEFDTAEIRLLDRETGILQPLISSGMDDDASYRALRAEATDNGVTGFVAATKRSYLCKDTTNDPLYLPGAPGARSSLTVPILLHDEILGTFNVESPVPAAFDQTDLKFLEAFAREVAIALNTLELLVVEKASTASRYANRVLSEVAGPVDDIINDAAWILERYIGHEPDVCERLQRILHQTRGIRRTIQRVGDDVPASARTGRETEPRPILRERRILVVDDDHEVRRAAHDLLCRYGCDVESAHHGEEALLMVRSFDYDAVIADIRLPDMTGYDCFAKLKKQTGDLPVILMTGYGYDPSHSIVKARQEGLQSVLYKPFRLDQLLGALEDALSPPEENKTEPAPTDDGTP